MSSVGSLPKRAGKSPGPHSEKRLTAAFVKGAPPGRYTDGGGLYLEVDRSGARRWLLRITIRGKRRDLGLGSATLVKLADARQKAQEYRRIARAGGDPRLEVESAAKASTTFKEVAERVHATRVKPSNRNGKHIDQWINTLRTYAFPTLGEQPVQSISRAEIMKVLEPIWHSKKETARRVHQRLEVVFDYALAMEYRAEGNPVDGVRKALPPQKQKVEHFSAMPWEMVPDLMRNLEEVEGVSALALRFTILTVPRPGSVRKATWDQIQEQAGLWHIPGENMKGGTEFSVPLCQAAKEVLRKAAAFKSGPRSLIFPSSKDTAKPLSEGALRGLMKRHGGGYTVHGFRSSFRNWTEEETSFPYEVKEAALAHAIPNKTEAAYRRLDYLEQRMKLMNQWGEFLSQNISAEAEAEMDRVLAELWQGEGQPASTNPISSSVKP